MINVLKQVQLNIDGKDVLAIQDICAVAKERLLSESIRLKQCTHATEYWVDGLDPKRQNDALDFIKFLEKNI